MAKPPEWAESFQPSRPGKGKGRRQSAAGGRELAPRAGAPLVTSVISRRRLGPQPRQAARPALRQTARPLFSSASYCLLPTVSCPLLSPSHLPPTTYHLPSTTYHLPLFPAPLPPADSRLPTADCLPPSPFSCRISSSWSGCSVGMCRPAGHRRPRPRNALGKAGGSKQLAEGRPWGKTVVPAVGSLL